MAETGMTDQEAPEITAESSRLIYENQWMRVREDVIRWQDGSKGIYGVVEKPDFVVIVPAEPDQSLYLVEQYRYPVRARHWELPQGAWEQAPDADPLDVARGELQEETGLAAGRMTYVGHLFQGYGYATQGYHIFLAQDLAHGMARPDTEEQGLVARRFTLAAVVGMMESGRIKDATTIATLGLSQFKGLFAA